MLAALERTRVRPIGAGETGRVAVLDYARARTRLFDVVCLLGLEEGSLPRRNRPTPLLDDDLRRGSAGGSSGRTRWSETSISSTRRARARSVELSSCVRPRATTACHAGRVRSRTTCARCTTRPRSAARPTAARSPLSPGLSTARPTARASACAGPARRGGHGRCDGARCREGLVAAPGAGPRAFDRQTRLRSPAVLDTLSSRTTFSATTSSASPTAPRRGSSSASSRRGGSTRSPTPSSAARSCTPRSTASTRACPGSSTRSA